jgi:hypothetical protein
MVDSTSSSSDIGNTCTADVSESFRSSVSAIALQDEPD